MLATSVIFPLLALTVVSSFSVEEEVEESIIEEWTFRRPQVHSGVEGSHPNTTGKYENGDELTRMMKTMKRNNKCRSGNCVKKQCSKNHKSKRQYFSIHVNFQNTMSGACGNCPATLSDCFNLNCGTGNGVERLSYFFDGKFMESKIEVCHNDIVVVDVVVDVSESIMHWHGIRQWRQPYMDGVLFVTQCIAVPDSVYRYEFVATDIGTHLFYGTQAYIRLEGLVGSLIVRSGAEPWNWLYDQHVISFKEWQSEFSYFAVNKNVIPEPITEAIIINGRGADCNENEDSSDGLTESDASASDTLTCSAYPLAEFLVEKGKHHRLRLINAGSLACPMQIQIDSHSMTVIAADGSLIVPVPRVKTIVMLPGERYDVIITTNQRLGAYWIHLKGLGDCAERKISQRALLVYKGATSTIPGHKNPGYRGYNQGLVLNPLNEHCIGMKIHDVLSDADRREHKKHGVCAYQLKKLKEKRKSASSDSHSSHHSSDSSDSSDYSLQSSASNHISDIESSDSDILFSSDSSSKQSTDSAWSFSNVRHHSSDSSHTDSSSGSSREVTSTSDGYRRFVQVELKYNIYTYMSEDGAVKLKGQINKISLQVPKSLIYGKSNFEKTFPDFRCRRDGSNETCLHIIKLRSGDKVDIILEHTDVADPIPNAFHLHGFKFQLLYQGHSVHKARDHRNFCKQPSIRDTVVVPAGGVARIRFHANNPGLWLLGSTREVVAEAGLGVILQVGDTKDFSTYPENLPTC